MSWLKGKNSSNSTTFAPKFSLLYRILLLIFLSAVAFHVAVAQSDTTNAEKLHIREIKFKGNDITKIQILLREMTIHEGDSILSAELPSTLSFNKRRILNLQLFSSVQFSFHLFDQKNVDIEFSLIEIFYWIPKPEFSLADRNFNVWWKEQNHVLERTNIGLQLTRINFRGRTERIGATIHVGYNKYFDLFYKIPFVDKKLKQGLGISATFSTGREINYRTFNNKILFYRNDEYPYRYFQTELTYTFRPAYSVIHEVNLSYNYYVITQDLYDINPLYLGGKKKINFFELKYTIGFNNTDIRVYPLNGIDAKVVLSKKGLGIDQDLNQFSTRVEASYYKKITQDISASLIFRGRISFPETQPYLTQKALGFKNEYVRGYEYYVIDGSHYGITRLNIRYKIMDRVLRQNAISFMHLIPVRIYGKVFDDLGYVYSKNPGNSFLNNRFMNGYGFGLDLVISYYMKFRFEYSFNHLKQNGLFLHGNKE